MNNNNNSFSCARVPLLLPSVRWPLGSTAKRKHLQRPNACKRADPSLFTSFVLLALVCLSSLLSNFVRLNAPIGQRAEHRNQQDAIALDKKQVRHHSHVAQAERVVAQRMRNLQHSLANLDTGVLLSLRSSSPQIINILLTGRQQRSATSRPGTPPSSSPTPTLVVTAAAGASPSAPFFNQQQQHQADDPTLMDYDAIDAFWRLDIEQEKSGSAALLDHHQQFDYEQQQQQLQLPSNLLQHNQPADAWEAATTPPAWAYNRQFERDLQLLTEKSLLSAGGQQQRTDEDGQRFFAQQQQQEGMASDNCCWSSAKLLPTSSSSGGEDINEHDNDWLNNILLEGDETDVTASGWTERWWKTVDDFTTVSVEKQDEEADGQQQQKSVGHSSHFRLDGQHLSHIRTKTEAPEDVSEDVEIFSHFPLSPLPHHFEDANFLDYEEEDESATEANSATEAILHDMTATIPLIQSLDFSSHSQLNRDDECCDNQLNVLENVPCSVANGCADFATVSSSSSSSPMSACKVDQPNQQACSLSSSVRCSSTSSGFGSFAGDLDDMPLSPANSSCTLLAADTEDYNNVEDEGNAGPSSSSLSIDNVNSEEGRQLSKAQSVASHAYRMEKLVPLLSSTTTATGSKRRRKLTTTNQAQRKTKKKQNTSSANKKAKKASKLEYDRELKRRQDEQEELDAIRSISADPRSTNGPLQQQQQQHRLQLVDTKVKQKRGRKSKDNSLVNEHDLPYSAEWLTAMPYSIYSELMNDFRLTTQQKALIKKIRRRGRNKLAAQKCRERRGQRHWESEDWSIVLGENGCDADDDDIILMREDDYDEIGEQIVEGDDDSQQPAAAAEDVRPMDPADLSLYSSTPTTSNDAVRSSGGRPRREDYSEFVHSAIAQRRAIRVQG